MTGSILENKIIITDDVTWLNIGLTNEIFIIFGVVGVMIVIFLSLYYLITLE